MSKIVITGAANQVGELQELGQDGSFKKREVIFKTIEEHTNYYRVEFLQGNTELVNNITEGNNYKITCNLRGRLSTNENGTIVFHSLVGWKVETA
nr:DUF3127 domain-containing protein [uncultured Allomuricauda sp.]